MDQTNACYVVKKQIDLLLEKPLSPNSVDLLYKLTNIHVNLKNIEFWKDTKREEVSSNGKYDRNINELLDKYIMSRKSGDECILTSALSELLAELSDLVVEIYNTAICDGEREEITMAIEKMTRH